MSCHPDAQGALSYQAKTYMDLMYLQRKVGVRHLFLSFDKVWLGLGHTHTIISHLKPSVNSHFHMILWINLHTRCKYLHSGQGHPRLPFAKSLKVRACRSCSLRPFTHSISITVYPLQCPGG